MEFIVINLELTGAPGKGTKMERLSDSAIAVNDIEVYANCSYSCYMNLSNTLNRLAAYENTGLEPEAVN